MHNHRFLVLSMLLLLSLAGPGCGPRSSAGDDQDGGGSNDNNGDAAVGDDATVCENVLCNGDCCAEGQWCRDSMCCDQQSSCGSHCCTGDEVCLGGHCYPDCGSGSICLDETDTEVCCAAGTICFMNQCVTPGGWCDSDADCALDEYCELAIPGCLPIPTSSCEYYPPVGVFTPTVEWEWPPPGGSAVQPNFVDVLTAPAVGDMDGDGVPEVVFIGYRDSCAGGGYWTGILTILRGDTGAEILRLDDPGLRLGSSTAPALGDLDGDGQAEVVVMGADYRLHAYTMDGTHLWTGEAPARQTLYGGIAIGDLDGDGHPNIVLGPSIYDHEGHFICSGTAGVGGSGVNRAISVLADMDMDGDMEVVAGNTVYHDDCTIMWQNTGVPDGYPAIGDIFDASGIADQDGWPEVALVSSGNVYVLNGQDGSVVWGPVAIPGNTSSNFGGAPVVADFDNDGYPEIGTAGGAFMAVFDPDSATPILWQQPTKDTSSAITGCTVFDFEGDGAAEIVYTDECFVYIYRGTDGEVLFQDSNTTRTHNEYPIVVDVDADGNSELLVTSNVCNWQCDTMAGWVGPARRGIRVYGDVQLNWVRTRSVWNQHSYHVTNVGDDLSIPTPELNGWVQPGLNNYRQNVQTWGVHNAPNMSGTLLGADTRYCSIGGHLAIGLMVQNLGSKGVPAGIPVGFYRIDENDNRDYLGYSSTQSPLLPGMIEYVEFFYNIPDDPLPDVFHFGAVVDDPAVGEVAIHECVETDNEVGPVEVSCNAVQ